MTIRHIRLAPHEKRCRPAHNDCGLQASCARQRAANIHGAATEDLSVDARAGWMGMFCPHYISIDRAEREVGERPVKPWIGRTL